MNEFLEQFLIEARELVEQATNDLLALERAPSDRGRLDDAFRAFHTLKGGAGIVDFAAMGRAAHAVEELLSAARDGRRPLTGKRVGACLSSLDQMTQWLDAIQDAGEVPDSADADADRLIGRIAEGETSADETPIRPPGETPKATEPALLPTAILNEQVFLLGVKGAGAAGRIASAGRVAVNVMRHLRRNEDAERITRALAESLVRLDPAPLASAISHAAQQRAESGEAPPTAAAATVLAHARTLRIDAARIDALVNLTGELTVAKNRIAHIAQRAAAAREPSAAALKQECDRLARLVGGLQRAVLELRVLPLRTVFQRFPRLVREGAENLGKPMRLVTEGDDTEADKAVVDALFEPLMHVVRNAMGHGVESGPDRAASGKPLVASITLRARREGEHVVVDVDDDGRGVDPALIRRVAVDRGVLSAERATEMGDEEATSLIFAPGFSTASQPSNLSGRGVGMDAVRAVVERLGGRVSVRSELGAGTNVRFVLPFSVMISRVMTVSAGGQVYGLPLEAVVETARIARQHIHPVGQAHVAVVKNRTVPLIDLGEALGRGPRRDADEVVVVVALLEGQMAALQVDAIGESMDVMLKPPAGLLAGTPEIAGTTMLRDGNVLLILDLNALAR